MVDVLRVCTNCKHKRDDSDGEIWERCDRPNYPEGNWNRLTSAQRYSMNLDNKNLCHGQHWEINEQKSR